MIIVTGGAGFIGSAFVWKCNQEGRREILVVDNLGHSEKWRNLVGLQYLDYLHKDVFIEALLQGDFKKKIQAIVHLGACSATTETDSDYLMENNYRYTAMLAEWAVKHQVRFIYASSAATYGNGELGFSDAHNATDQLKPINRYGYSKHFFDLAALSHHWLDKIVGLKFFNVFGPNEYHKGEMRSVICKSYQQIQATGVLNLFKSYLPAYPDGGQKRDFIYVKDCANVLFWLMENKKIHGLFNLGTGVARTWNDLGQAIFAALNKPVNIAYGEMPAQLQGQYQYFTQADMTKLTQAGYATAFTPLEAAVADYVQNYLANQVHLTTF